MKLFSIILTFLLFSLYSTYAETKDCFKYSKLSKEYLKCTKDNLKQKSNDSGLTNKVENFKSSKTLTEFFKKNRGEK